MAQHRSSNRPAHRFSIPGRIPVAIMLAGIVGAVLVAAIGPLAVPALSANPSASLARQQDSTTKLATAAMTRGSGVYTGPCQVAAARQFAAARQRSNGVVVDTLDTRTFARLADPRWWTGCWGVGAPMVYGVAIIPTQSGGTLAQGAAGAYDGYFRLMAQRLVAGGQGTAWLRLGWEFNGSWYPWSAASSPTTFAAYYRRIVTVMRSVPGASFRYVWNPTIGAEQFPAEQAWPGDSYVDAIGLDLYDISWQPDTYPVPSGATETEVATRQQNAWSGFRRQDHGLDFWTAYARTHNKPMALPEWGLVPTSMHGGGDDAAFIAHVRRWVMLHNVEFESYFDAVGDLGDHRLESGQYPAAQAAYASDFGATGTVPHLRTADVHRARTTRN